MKKLYFYLLMTLSVFALTSCDTDERIANGVVICISHLVMMVEYMMPLILK